MSPRTTRLQNEIAKLQSKLADNNKIMYLQKREIADLQKEILALKAMNTELAKKVVEA